ncbi:MAG: endonuclease domain-containing protein [Deltaproteobacteria bacterium]|nr:endonuclease domain-containing protein [Deltaproteobacteria bacterium]
MKYPARELRCAMTPEESMLWDRLRRKQLKGVQFYRQRPLGRFIVDFYAPSARLVVEVDGSHHSQLHQSAIDRERSVWLEAEGFQVLRFSNHDVTTRIEAVVQCIAAAIPAG